MRARRVAAGGLGVLAAGLLVSACSGGDTPPATPTGSTVSASVPAGIVAVRGTLPQGFPEGIAQPQGFMIQAGARTTMDGKPNYTVTYAAEGDQSDTVKDYLGTLKGTGFKVSSQIPSQQAGAGKGLWTLKSSEWKVGLIEAVSDGRTTLVLNVSPTDK